MIDSSSRIALESLAVQASRAGAAALQERRCQPHDIRFKGQALNIVTEADLAAEAAVLGVIREARPHDGIRSEEQPEIPGSSDLTWVIDPLDSTANYARGLPIYSVSVAVTDDTGPVAAAVAEPSHGRVFSTYRGSGAIRIDGEPVTRVGRPGAEQQAIALFGLDAFWSGEHPRTEIVPAALYRRYGKVRSPGSPALGLAWIAAGYADLGYYEMGFNDWDVVAGCLLCQEAGLSVLLRDPVAAGFGRRLLVGVPRFVSDVRGELLGG